MCYLENKLRRQWRLTGSLRIQRLYRVFWKWNIKIGDHRELLKCTSKMEVERVGRHKVAIYKTLNHWSFWLNWPMPWVRGDVLPLQPLAYDSIIKLNLVRDRVIWLVGWSSTYSTATPNIVLTYTSMNKFTSLGTCFLNLSSLCVHFFFQQVNVNVQSSNFEMTPLTPWHLSLAISLLCPQKYASYIYLYIHTHILTYILEILFFYV